MTNLNRSQVNKYSIPDITRYVTFSLIEIRDIWPTYLNVLRVQGHAYTGCDVLGIGSFVSSVIDIRNSSRRHKF